MSTGARARAALALLLELALAACSEGTTEPRIEERDEDELQFLRFPPDLAPLATRDTSFWAVAGEERELVLYYADSDEDDGELEEFLEFEIEGGSLGWWPDGRRFEEGDSVEIRVRVDDEGRFLFRFEPSGLRFDPDDPAEIEITYRRLGGDLDGDGDLDEDDEDFEEELRIWKQERPGAPWVPVGTLRLDDESVRGFIDGFTGFALAV